MHQMTKEQQAIVDCELNPGETLKIMAFAGTGKTTTLEAYTRKRPHVRFLYIAFNKSVQTEAARRFPNNVTARTAHALAFRTKGFQHKDRLVPGFKANQVMAALDLDRYEDARFTIDTLNAFLVSKDPKVETRHIPGTARAFYKKNKISMPDLVTKANSLGRLMCDGSNPDIGMLHDGYLKLFQLSCPVLDYDCILLDEAQDTNAVIAAIVFAQIRQTSPDRQPASLILVGDMHQQVYSFRGAKDSLKRFNATSTLYLTQSFRFDNNVARAANMILSVFKKEKRTLQGTPVPQKNAWNPDQYTIIARTNAALFDKAVRLMEKHPIGFSGGVAGYSLPRLKDVYYLYSGEKEKIRDGYIKGFKSFDVLKSYARTVEDFEIATQCRLVEKYRSRLPSLVDRVKEKAKDLSSGQDGVLLTTAHKSKGLEWPQVLVLDDFAPVMKDGIPVPAAGADPDEFNLIYVAVTRAMVHLRFDKKSDIPEFIRYYLTHNKK
ncbi:MAG: UvrD-helicase domain-containing protein [Desulfobacterales bacterium]|nr:UvrD-helicase domain-containing protein [Desulfobacterales bacterium]